MSSTAVLPGLPGAVSVAYTYHPPTSSSSPVLVFINGLRMPASGWAETIAALSTTQPYLVYDRPGQFEGASPPLPASSGTHDIVATADQLASLLEALKVPRDQRLVLVSNSIGCIIARIFSASAPYTNVVAHLFLDSNVSNTDFVSLLPAPSDGEPPELTRTRDTLGKFFHPSVPNGEKLDRSTVPSLMPSASDPKLPGQPYVTVVGHDPVTFLEGGAKVRSPLTS